MVSWMFRNRNHHRAVGEREASPFFQIRNMGRHLKASDAGFSAIALKGHRHVNALAARMGRNQENDVEGALADLRFTFKEKVPSPRGTEKERASRDHPTHAEGQPSLCVAVDGSEAEGSPAVISSSRIPCSERGGINDSLCRTAGRGTVR